MLSLKGKKIYLRALEPEDLEFVHAIENDPSYWGLSDTQAPFSKYIITQYLQNAQQDIYEAKQLRLAICTINHRIIGLIDLFDFNFKNKRAGIGIIINETSDRKQGYASDALKVLLNYCFSVLHLHQVYANILEENIESLKLFTVNGFEIIGLKKDWTYNGKDYKNQYLLQRINQ